MRLPHAIRSTAALSRTAKRLPGFRGPINFDNTRGSNTKWVLFSPNRKDEPIGQSVCTLSCHWPDCEPPARPQKHARGRLEGGGASLTGPDISPDPAGQSKVHAGQRCTVGDPTL